MLVCLGLPLWAAAQDGQLRLPELSHLQEEAAQSVNVTLGPKVLGLISAFADDGDADFDRIKKAFDEITSVTVRSFKFDTPVQPGAELEDLRRQLATPAWSPLVQVHDRDKSEDVAVYVAYGERVVHGLVILAVSPQEISLVHVAGTLEPSRIAELRLAFAHPNSAVVKSER
jgi:hypothetical protein